MNIERPKSKLPIPDHAKKVFEGTIFNVYSWEQEMFDGSTQTFEKIERPDTVIVIPVMDDGTILLTEEEQPGREKYFSSPGGRIDREENVLEAAKRELLEETGYEAKEYILWDAEQPLGKIEWAIFTFIAKGLKRIKEPHLDAGEKIALKHVSFEEFLDYITNPDTGDKGTMSKVYQAIQDPKKMDKLKKLFKPL